MALFAAAVMAWIGLEFLGGHPALGPLLLFGAVVLVYVTLALLSVSVRCRAFDRFWDPIGRRPELRWLGSRRTWVVLGVVFVLLVASWMVMRIGLGLPLVAGFLVALLVFFVLFVADGIGDLAAVLVVLSLAWALNPRSVELPASGPIDDQQTVLVALGDSYISGEGAEEFYADTNVRGKNECRRADTAYAPRLVKDRTQPEFDRLVFLACSGARAVHLDGLPQYQDEPVDGPVRLRPDGSWKRGATQLEQLDEALRAVPQRVLDQGGEPSPELSQSYVPPGESHGLVLLSLGGNDAGFGKIALTCLSAGDCSEVVPHWKADLKVVGERLDRAYASLRKVIGPNVPVLVIPYPVPLAADRCDLSAMTSKEHVALRDFVESLDETVREAARKAGFSYLELQDAFKDKQICGPGDSDSWYFNYFAANPVSGELPEMSNPRNWFHNSLHPNEKGHGAIANMIKSWVAEHKDEILASRFELPSTPFRATGISESEDWASVAETSLGVPSASDADSATKPSAEEDIGSGECTVQGNDWEGKWAACRTGRVLQRFVLPTILFMVAMLVVAIPILGKVAPVGTRLFTRIRAFIAAHLAKGLS